MHLCASVCVLKMMSSAPASKRTWRGQGTWQGRVLYSTFHCTPSLSTSAPLTDLNRDSNIGIVMLIVHRRCPRLVIIIFVALLLFVLLITWRVDKANTIELAWRALKITHTPRLPRPWMRSAPSGLVLQLPSMRWSDGNCWVEIHRTKLPILSRLQN